MQTSPSPHGRRSSGRPQAEYCLGELKRRHNIASRRLDFAARHRFDDWLAAPSDDEVTPRGVALLRELLGLPPVTAAEACQWYLTQGHSVVPLGAVVDEVAKCVLATAGDHVASGADQRGTVLVGPASATSGLGTMTRAVYRALVASGQAVALRDVAHRNPVADSTLFERRDDWIGDTVILAINAVALEGFASGLPLNWHRGRRAIGLWAWEQAAMLPAMAASSRWLHEIWTISDFCRTAIARVVDCPVHVMPLPIEQPAGDPGPQFERVDTRRPRSYFLFCFDALGSIERKNPVGLLRAYDLAFPNRDGPALVIKALNVDADEPCFTEIRERALSGHDVVLIEDPMTSGELGSLVAGATAYVSLHRSEGFGLTLAEAMLRGTPVITTCWSGQADFADDRTAWLVPCRLVEAGEDAGVYARTVWAEPDILAAAKLMREVATAPAAELRTRADRAQARIRERYSQDALDRFVQVRLSSASRVEPGDLPQ